MMLERFHHAVIHKLSHVGKIKRFVVMVPQQSSSSHGAVSGTQHQSTMGQTKYAPKIIGAVSMRVLYQTPEEVTQESGILVGRYLMDSVPLKFLFACVMPLLGPLTCCAHLPTRVPPSLGCRS
ncbi:unnamed protein product [Ectocarpus sp. 13 AM-2016]